MKLYERQDPDMCHLGPSYTSHQVDGARTASAARSRGTPPCVLGCGALLGVRNHPCGAYIRSGVLGERGVVVRGDQQPVQQHVTAALETMTHSNVVVILSLYSKGMEMHGNLFRR